MRIFSTILLGAMALSLGAPTLAAEPDLILHGGKIVTVDERFSVAEAIALAEGRIVAVGADAEVLPLRGEKTQVVDLAGKMVLPGLIDSHVHASGAAMYEFDHELPTMDTIDDVLAYIRARAKIVPEGEWITMSQVFITRLREQRYPTRAELDAAAPKHPVVFATGPDAMLNSLALRESGIDRDFKLVGTGRIERSPDGEPTGLLRSASRYIKSKSRSRSATEADRQDRLEKLFRDYNSVGITGVIDRNAGGGDIGRFQQLRAAGRLTVRVAASHSLGRSAKVSDTLAAIGRIAEHRLTRPDPWVRVIGVKMFLDGGMLTGSAYMREPWGVSSIYSITDPEYRGVLFIPADELLEIVRETTRKKLQFTAHSVGDGAVHTLLDVYQQVGKELPLRELRPCLTHANFLSREAVEIMAREGVVADIQPAWLYLDGHTLQRQFGEERLTWFQPLKSLLDSGVTVGGGSDHMQKLGSLRSVNPYDPWLGMWTTLTRQPRDAKAPLHPEQRLSREQAIIYYTRNNARLMFLEEEIGTLEAGKRADLIIVDRDLLKCSDDELRGTQVLATYVEGKEVFRRMKSGGR